MKRSYIDILIHEQYKLHISNYGYCEAIIFAMSDCIEKYGLSMFSDYQIEQLFVYAFCK